MNTLQTKINHDQGIFVSWSSSDARQAWENLCNSINQLAMLKGYHFVGANGDGLLWLLEEEGKQGIEEQRFTRYFINQTKMLLRLGSVIGPDGTFDRSKYPLPCYEEKNLQGLDYVPEVDIPPVPFLAPAPFTDRVQELNLEDAFPAEFDDRTIEGLPKIPEQEMIPIFLYCREIYPKEAQYNSHVGNYYDLPSEKMNTIFGSIFPDKFYAHPELFGCPVCPAASFCVNMIVSAAKGLLTEIDVLEPSKTGRVARFYDISRYDFRNVVRLLARSGHQINIQANRAVMAKRFAPKARHGFKSGPPEDLVAEVEEALTLLFKEKHRVSLVAKRYDALDQPTKAFVNNIIDNPVTKAKMNILQGVQGASDPVLAQIESLLENSSTKEVNAGDWSEGNEAEKAMSSSRAKSRKGREIE